MKKLTLLGGLMAVCLITYAQSYTISGYISDADNGESLIGATILEKGTARGTITNTFGFYSLTLPAGEVTLQVSFVGYQIQTETIQLNKDIKLNFDLPSGETLEEVVITAEEQIEQSPQMSTIDVPIEQIKALPVLMGESDILKTLQLLPGIQSGSEGTSGVYVRGGGPDQNLILLDGVPVYNVSHLFGFFSVFNPDAINRVNVVKGGFPARYGGRLSSVIDISMKEGNNQKFSGEGSIGLISSKLTLEGPIGKQKKTSFIVSGRRTYIDLLTRPIIRASSDGTDTGGYYFYDLNGKINHRFSDNDRLYLSFYNGYDKGFGKSKYDYDNGSQQVVSKESFGLGWGNTIGAIRWNHVYNPKLFSNLTGTFSHYKFRIFSEYKDVISYPDNTEEVYEELIEYFSGVNDFALKLDFDYLPVPEHSIKFGISGTHHQFNPGIFGYDTNTEGEQDTVINSTQTTAGEFYAYAEDDYSINSKFRANFGAHYSGFLVNSKYYHSLQPRISLRYLISDDLSIKASYATMAQYIHLLTNSSIGLPTDLWVPATDRVRPQTSWQAAIGAAKTIQGYEFSIEGYYKEMNNLIEYQEGASFFNLGTDWQDKVTSGEGTSYGAEFLIQKKTGKLSGWIGYTLSWTNRTFAELNFGKTYPYKYDRRHDLSIVGTYQFSKKFSLSSTWVYGTGNAMTLPKFTYPDERTSGFYYSDITYYGERNDFRMAAYHRLDIGLTWTKPKKNGTRSWSTGAYNVYNRKNPFYIEDGYDNQGNKHFYQYSLFPIIPYVKYSFKF
ncbi:TonB-dependent receptor [Marinoscillum pacificum]|uniref:TonB-dependent receptor n=1 Tax=Marinoscillum pacificum TaxID=392723 RepID=UPI00280C06AC|nr:TonB-dependent receptor [Marinoscillum pacificum]